MSQKARRAARRAQMKLTTPVGEAITQSDVLNVIAQAWPEPMSRRGICDACGRQVTPSMIAKIEALADAGWVTRDVQV